MLRIQLIVKTLLTFILAILICLGAQAKNKLPIAFLSFDGLHVAADGTRYAADGADGTNVYKVDDKGVITVFATGLAGPIDITSDSAGNLFVTNFNKPVITKIEPDGTTSEFAVTDLGPSGITIDEYDNLYVSQYGSLAGGGDTVYQITPNGEVSVYAQGGLLDTSVGITMDDLGNLYVANFNNGKIIKITPQREQILMAEFPSPDGFAIGHLVYANNRLFATGLIDQLIYIIRNNGRVRARDIVKEGEFPNGIALDATRNEVIFTNTFAASFGFDRIRLPKQH
ncbi:hypothetical protein PN836_020705 [Ningiella sp. W23]|uniref:Vgb family protein n=1 Tax=Ningiella sp. W23 TaxID=3023715 RepID=UPI0037577C5D